MKRVIDWLDWVQFFLDNVLEYIENARRIDLLENSMV